MKLPFLLAIAMSLCITCGYSQNSIEYAKYMENAKERAVLYRGATPMYYPFYFTGSYFAYSDEYLKGEVVYNGKRYYGVLLNLNSNLDQLYIYDMDNGVNVVLNKDFVESFTMGENSFVNLNRNEISAGLQQGYYQVLWSGAGTKLLKRIRKNYSEKIAQDGNTTSKNKVARSFVPEVEYYIIDDETAYEVRNLNSFRRIFGVKKSLLYKFKKTNNLSLRKDTDNAFSMLMKFIHSRLPLN
ncbi:MAG: hypothetical protein PHP33_05805 [Bacteroidales bacterium]|nr:hypothetical protein [Bacteroidales bacterium]MDD3844146.1 hypothetical protein [Bacteroidales bacterium]MDD4618588.1 hypothetical protein [Bacteroidales bacterium]